MENSVLKDLGLTEGEIRVYYSLFELGETTVGPISKASGITHAKVYPILDKLISKGLTSHIIKNGRKNFSATNPNSLLEFVDKKVRSLEEEKKKIKDIIPTLLLKQKELEETQYSRVFEGFKGLRSLFYEIFHLNKNSEILVLGLDEILKKPSYVSFFKFYHDLRKENNIKLKLIAKKDMNKIVNKYMKAGMYSETDEVKLLDTVFPTGVFIINDHVITIVEETAFDIKSKQNAERYKEFFNSIWG